MCQYRFVRFHCTCPGQVWLKACEKPDLDTGANLGYPLCRHKSFQAPYTVALSSVCSDCFILLLQEDGFHIDSNGAVFESNEDIRGLLGDFGSGVCWLSMSNDHWESIVLGSVAEAGSGTLELEEMVLNSRAGSTVASDWLQSLLQGAWGIEAGLEELKLSNNTESIIAKEGLLSEVARARPLEEVVTVRNEVGEDVKNGFIPGDDMMSSMEGLDGNGDTNSVEDVSKSLDSMHV